MFFSECVNQKIMPVRFKVVQKKITGSKTFGKWYGRAVSMGTVTTKMLAEEISHSTTVTRSDIAAVLIELCNVMKQHLQDSKTVQLDDLGSFKVTFNSAPADKEADFTANNIKKYRIIYRPVTTFIASGDVTATGRRSGFYVKSLLNGVTAEPLDKSKKAASTETTKP